MAYYPSDFILYANSLYLADNYVPSWTKAYRDRYSNVKLILNPLFSIMDPVLTFRNDLAGYFNIVNGADITDPYKCYSKILKLSYDDPYNAQIWCSEGRLYVAPQYHNFIDCYPTRYTFSGDEYTLPTDYVDNFLYAFAFNSGNEGCIFTVEDDYIYQYDFPNFVNKYEVDSGYFTIEEVVVPRSELTYTAIDDDNGYYEWTLSHSMVEGSFSLYCFPYYSDNMNYRVDTGDYEIIDEYTVRLLQPRPSFNHKNFYFSEDGAVTGWYLDDPDKDFQPHEEWLGRLVCRYRHFEEYAGYFTTSNSRYSSTQVFDPKGPTIYTPIVDSHRYLRTSIERLFSNTYLMAETYPSQTITVTGEGLTYVEETWDNPSWDSTYTITITDGQMSEDLTSGDVGVYYYGVYGTKHRVPPGHFAISELGSNYVTISGEYQNYTSFTIRVQYKVKDSQTAVTYVDYNFPANTYTVETIFNENYVKPIPVIDLTFTGTLGDLQAAYDSSLVLDAYVEQILGPAIIDHQTQSLLFMDRSSGRILEYNVDKNDFDYLGGILTSGAYSEEYVTVYDAKGKFPYKEIWYGDAFITGYVFRLYDIEPIDTPIDSIAVYRKLWYILCNNKIYVCDSKYDRDSHKWYDPVELDSGNEYRSLTIGPDGNLLILTNDNSISTLYMFYDYAFIDPIKQKIFFREYYEWIIISGLDNYDD